MTELTIERLALLVAILQSPLVTVSRLELSTAEAGAFISTQRASILREIYIVAKEQERKNGKSSTNLANQTRHPSLSHCRRHRFQPPPCHPNGRNAHTASSTAAKRRLASCSTRKSGKRLSSRRGSPCPSPLSITSPSPSILSNTIIPSLRLPRFCNRPSLHSIRMARCNSSSSSLCRIMGNIIDALLVDLGKDFGIFKQVVFLLSVMQQIERTSSPTLIGLPPQPGSKTRSPMATLTGTTWPSLLAAPGPTAMTVASGKGDAVADEGRKMPLVVFCRQLIRETTHRFRLEALDQNAVK